MVDDMTLLFVFLLGDRLLDFLLSTVLSSRLDFVCALVVIISSPSGGPTTGTAPGFVALDLFPFLGDSEDGRFAMIDCSSCFRISRGLCVSLCEKRKGKEGLKKD